MHPPLLPTLAGLALAAAALSRPAGAAEEAGAGPPRFTGSPSCASSSCHGGGTGRNEAVLFNRQDRHTAAAGILEKGTSLRIAEALKIAGDPVHDQRCNVCHAPLQGVPLEHLLKEAQEERSFACETCHGAAENWLRFHTRKDATFPQIVAAGMRNLNDLYSRANTCVGCHVNLDESIRAAGHPELNFELDGQALAEPPHYQDARPSLGPRSWLTGQAAALREMSARLAVRKEAPLVPRWKALLWLLRRTEAGRRELPANEDFAAVQSGADQLARSAATTLWTKDQPGALLAEYLKTAPEFADPKANPEELRRRAEVLVPALDRLWRAWKKEAEVDSAAFQPALEKALLAAREGEYFKPADFAAALRELQEALPKGAAR